MLFFYPLYLSLGKVSDEDLRRVGQKKESTFGLCSRGHKSSSAGSAYVLEKKSFLNPDTAEFIVVFNNVWLAASWRSCPRCIYFLSDTPPNNPVIPCGPTTQTAAMRPPSPAPPGPLPRPPRRHSKTHSPALLRPKCPSLSRRRSSCSSPTTSRTSSSHNHRFYFIFAHCTYMLLTPCSLC